MLPNPKPMTLVDLGWCIRDNPATFEEIVDWTGWSADVSIVILETAIKAQLVVCDYLDKNIKNETDMYYVLTDLGTYLLDDYRLQKAWGFQ
jgi:hypothetical protein